MGQQRPEKTRLFGHHVVAGDALLGRGLLKIRQESLALGGSDKLIHIIDAQDQYEKALLTGHQDDIVSVSFSPTDEATLVSLARVSRQEKAAFDLFVWDAHAATKLAAAQGQGSGSDARWSSDGLYIAVACQGRSVDLFKQSHAYKKR